MRHVIFFGNALHSDDGFGAAVYQRLAALKLPADVRLFEAGTCGLNALALFEGCREAIIVDALQPGGHPGKVSRLPAGTLLPESSLAGHAAGVGYLLAALAAIGLPQPGIIAAEAVQLQPFSQGLSQAMQQAVETATRLLCQTLGIEHDDQ